MGYATATRKGMSLRPHKDGGVCRMPLLSGKDR
jgi:hypothetical protein